MLKKWLAGIGIIVIVLFLVSGGLFLKENNWKNVVIPPIDTEINSNDRTDTIELKDYICSYSKEKNEYILTDKKSRARRKLFNNPFEDKQSIIMQDMYGYENKLYYGTSNTFYCYDIDNDKISELYVIENKPQKITLFDVTVFNKVVTRKDIETYAKQYFIAAGNLIIVTNYDIRKFDGKKTKVLIKGDYISEKYEDGILYFHKDSENSDDEYTLNLRE